MTPDRRNFFRAACLLAFALACAAAGAAPKSFTVLDFWQRKCREDDAEACAQAERAKAENERSDRLNRYAREFAARVDRAALEDGRHPRLDLAYPLVVRDYLGREPGAREAALALSDAAMADCAGHYSNFWINKKLWWPTGDDGRPDWASIYLFIIDHYYGFCLRTSSSVSRSGRPTTPE